MTKFRIASALAIALLLGSLLQPLGFVAAQTRFGRGPQPQPAQAFESGSERSLPVLREILTTLKRMDQRLQRIETKVLQMDTK